MKLHPLKTERGYELADEIGTLESETLSEVFPTRKAAQAAANEANRIERTFDRTAHFYAD